MDHFLAWFAGIDRGCGAIQQRTIHAHGNLNNLFNLISLFHIYLFY